MAKRLLPMHPGEVLREDFLRPMNLPPHAVARAVGVPRTRIERLTNEQTAVTADTALRLARYFGTSRVSRRLSTFLISKSRASGPFKPIRSASRSRAIVRWRSISSFRWGRATPVARSSWIAIKTRDWSRAPPTKTPVLLFLILASLVGR
jgi:addiction module HigA family antidote